MSTLDLSQFDARIGELSAQQQSLAAEMDSLCLTFLSATERFAQQWLEDAVQQARDARPEVITEMPIEQIRQLKAQIHQTAEQLPSLVADSVGEVSYWGHRDGHERNGHVPNQRYAVKDRKPPSELDGVVRSLLGRLGGILIEHGLVDSEKDGWWDMHGAAPRYIGPYQWSDKMLITMQRYSAAYEKLCRVQDQITELHRRKLQIVANEKWEQA